MIYATINLDIKNLNKKNYMTLFICIYNPFSCYYKKKINKCMLTLQRT